ncbi:MAG TPA: hypothetical protein ENI08_02130, partial [Candidatus Dependentiae bacterium]|nr:hypothetical protein [Candidatus Dependentiae bacterium]
MKKSMVIIICLVLTNYMVAMEEQGEGRGTGVMVVASCRNRVGIPINCFKKTMNNTYKKMKHCLSFHLCSSTTYIINEIKTERIQDNPIDNSYKANQALDKFIVQRRKRINELHDIKEILAAAN